MILARDIMPLALASETLMPHNYSTELMWIKEKNMVLRPDRLPSLVWSVRFSLLSQWISKRTREEVVVWWWDGVGDRVEYGNTYKRLPPPPPPLSNMRPERLAAPPNVCTRRFSRFSRFSRFNLRQRECYTQKLCMSADKTASTRWYSIRNGHGAEFSIVTDFPAVRAMPECHTSASE